MPEPMSAPEWLNEHRASRPYSQRKGEVRIFDITGLPSGGWDVPVPPTFSREVVDEQLLLADQGFNNHHLNDGTHVSPYDEGRVNYGLDGLQVRLIQGVNEDAFKLLLSRSLRATTGIHPNEITIDADSDADEMMRGGLQSALESQVVVFEVIGASRALTHQLVRSRKAAFHQQSQRATWYGDRPNVRRPMSIMNAGDVQGPRVSRLWDRATLACWEAYKAACDAGVSYQDARYILPEGTENYILCEYSVREFINVFAYRGCSMFLWEMVGCMREMRRVLLESHPFLEPYVKISCEKPVGNCRACDGSGTETIPAVPREGWEDINCRLCGGDGKDRKCTFQGWENVEKVCDFPWARQGNRVFLPAPRNRIGDDRPDCNWCYSGRTDCPKHSKSKIVKGETRT